MPHSKNLQRDLIPKHLDPRQLQKASGSLAEVFARDVPKRKTVSVAPGTATKLATTILAQMVARTSAGGAGELLACVQETLVSFSGEVLASPNPVAVLEAFVAKFGGDTPAPAFHVSPPTVSKQLDRFTVAEADALLSDQVDRLRGLMGKRGLWPKEVLVVLDPTDEPYYGKYKNQYTNWGLVGQHNTYKRVFKGLGIFLSPAQLLAGFAPMPLKGKDPTKREVPGWIQEARRVILDLHAAGTTVPLVAFDREFYSALGMALAGTGQFVPGLPPGENPRLVCPKKFWSDQAGSKWAFLLDPDAPAVREECMQLNYYDQRVLGDAARTLERDEKGAHRLVPTWTIASFDAYAEGKRSKSLKWAHQEAARVERGIRAAAAAKVEAEAEFRRYTRDVLRVERKMPAYRGAGRKRFKYGGERKRYRACREAHERLQRWKREKGALCQHLVFFTASKRPGETLAGAREELLALPTQYRERWGIENGFKSIKADFKIRTNSRKTTARHLRFIVSAMAYNAWHYRRLDRLGRRVKRTRQRWKPFDDSSPPIREKFERQFRPSLTARGFLLEELGEALDLSVKLAIAAIS